MANQTTERMKLALKYIKRGKTPAQAAELAGVKRQSIYTSGDYKKLRDEMAAKAAK